MIWFTLLRDHACYCVENGLLWEKEQKVDIHLRLVTGIWAERKPGLGCGCCWLVTAEVVMSSAIRMHFGGEPMGHVVLWQMGQGRAESRTTPTALTEMGHEGTEGSSRFACTGNRWLIRYGHRVARPGFIFMKSAVGQTFSVCRSEQDRICEYSLIDVFKSMGLKRESHSN